MTNDVIAFFDFDGTITNKDSLPDFIKYVVGKKRYYIGIFLLCPMLVRYMLKLIPNYTAKEKLISHFFKEKNEIEFKKIANQYSIEQIDKIVRPKAIEQISWHKNNNHKIVVVSASMEDWLHAWCKQNDLDLIGTKLDFDNGVFTGNFLSKNCYGIEKVNRIKEVYDLSKFTKVYAYGDSLGDKEMLSIASEQHYKFF